MTEDLEIDQEGIAAAFEAARNGGTSSVDVVDKPTVVADPPVTEPPAIETLPQKTDFNPSEYFKTATEGFIDSEEKFKEFIPKIKNYDDLETKLKAAEASKVEFKNSETEALYKAWANGDKDAVVNYIKETTKDYKTMSDVDVVRESLAKKNPSWSQKDVELELRAEYGKQLELIDLSDIDEKDEEGKYTDEYKQAVAHNDRVEENQLRLQRAARDARISLIDQQSKIELPKIKEPEQAQVSNAPTEEEMAERTQAWLKSVEDNMPKLSNIKMNIDDKEVEYVRTDVEKKELHDYMKTFNLFKLAKDQGWQNEDGTPNPLKIAEDVDLLRNWGKIVKSTSTQVKTEATKDALKKIKNITTDTHTPEMDEEPQSLEEANEQARKKAGW